MMPLADIAQWADVFVKSGMFKDAKSVAQAIVKIQAGQELGLPPFAAMRGFDVIEGKPAPNAGLTAALIKRSGRYGYNVTRSDATACVLEWTEGGRVIGETAFTMDEAKAAGLAGRGPWKAYPQDMLFARALTRGARRFCADVFMGSVYTPEELGADEDHEPLVMTLPSRSAEPTFNGPGSFTEYAGDMLDKAAAAVVLDKAGIDDDFSWRAAIETAPDAKAVLRIYYSLENEPNGFRRGGAYRIAAERFASLVPDSLPYGAIQPTLDALAGMCASIETSPTPEPQAADRERVIGIVQDKITAVRRLLPPADADSVGPATHEELEGDL
jgi:hypothetical protein